MKVIKYSNRKELLRKLKVFKKTSPWGTNYKLTKAPANRPLKRAIKYTTKGL